MKKNIDMLNGSLYSGILRYTIPVILTSLLQLLFNAADLIVVGQYCGSISVAAVGATTSLTSLIVNLFIGLSVGAGASVATALGARQNARVHRFVHTAIPTALVCGVILTVIGEAFAPAMLRLMKTPENVLPLSTVYMRIYFGGITFSMLYNFSAAILRAAGDTKSPLTYLTIAGVVNVALNIFFVTVCKMNVDGVAWATITSQAISAALVVIALTRRTDACRLQLNKMRIYGRELGKIIQIGLPAGLQSSLFAISNVIIQSSVNSFNSDAIMSGNSSAQNIEGFVYVTMNSFGQAAINFTGQNLGAHQFNRIKKIYRVCLGYVALFGVLFGGGAYLFSRQLLSIYINDSPEAIHYGMTRMVYIALPYFICGMMDVSTFSLRGLGASMTPMIISVVGACGFRVAWIYTIFQIPQFHTLNSLYVSYPISWILTFLAEFIAFTIVFKKKAQTEQLSVRSRV